MRLQRSVAPSTSARAGLERWRAAARRPRATLPRTSRALSQVRAAPLRSSARRARAACRASRRRGAPPTSTRPPSATTETTLREPAGLRPARCATATSGAVGRRPRADAASRGAPRGDAARAASASVHSGGSSAEATRSSARCARAVPDSSPATRSSARPATSTPSSASVPSSGGVGARCRARQRPLAWRTRAVRSAAPVPCSSPSLAMSGQRPATCAARLQRCRPALAAARRAAGAGPAREQRRQRARRGASIDDAPVVVARAARRDPALGLEALPPATRSSAGRARAVAVGELASPATRHAGERRCRRSPALGVAARRRERGVDRISPASSRRAGRSNVAVGVETVRAAREQRVGAAGPPRRRVEARRARARPLARHGASPVAAHEPAVERRARVAERRVGAAQLDLVRAGARIEAKRAPTSARRAAGARRRARRRGRREVDSRRRAAWRRWRRARGSAAARARSRCRRRATLPLDARLGARASSAAGRSLAQLGVEVPARGDQRPRPAMLPAARPAEPSSADERVCTSSTLGACGPRAQFGVQRRTGSRPSFQRPARALARSIDTLAGRSMPLVVAVASPLSAVAGAALGECGQVEAASRGVQLAERPGARTAGPRRARRATAPRAGAGRGAPVARVRARAGRRARARPRASRRLRGTRRRAAGAWPSACRAGAASARGDCASTANGASAAIAARRSRAGLRCRRERVEAVAGAGVGAEVRRARAGRGPASRRRCRRAARRRARAHLELERQAQVVRRVAGSVARRRRCEAATSTRSACKRVDRQVQPAAVVAARRRQAVPARRVEAQLAAAGGHGIAAPAEKSPISGPSARPRVSRGTQAEQPGAAARAVHRPEQRRRSPARRAMQQAAAAPPASQRADACAASRRRGRRSLGRRRPRAMDLRRPSRSQNGDAHAQVQAHCAHVLRRRRGRAAAARRGCASAGRRRSRTPGCRLLPAVGGVAGVDEDGAQQRRQAVEERRARTRRCR